MEFKDNYTTKDKYDLDPIKEKGKTIISTDIYAIGDVVNELIKQIDKTRRDLI